MRNNLKIIKFRFFSSVAIIYIATVGLIWQAIQPNKHSLVTNIKLSSNLQSFTPPLKPKLVEIFGSPNRLVIPESNIDLVVLPGMYDRATDSWTLSGYDAQYATISSLPNNNAGQTFIYGHNNNYVFGALRHHTPLKGQPALIYLSNGHILKYTFSSAQNIGPNDVSILNYNGKPSLLIQTCTGSLNEWRTEYRYNFDKVLQ
ncbi:MAG TPA: sortase [Patescibacteria group bacterium]|nr:sortase [Patescibacteria group bacterium]